MRYYPLLNDQSQADAQLVGSWTTAQIFASALVVNADVIQVAMEHDALAAAIPSTAVTAFACTVASLAVRAVTSIEFASQLAAHGLEFRPDSSGKAFADISPSAHPHLMEKEQRFIRRSAWMIPASIFMAAWVMNPAIRPQEDATPPATQSAPATSPVAGPR
jgi:hypothetical protein